MNWLNEWRNRNSNQKPRTDDCCYNNLNPIQQRRQKFCSFSVRNTHIENISNLIDINDSRYKSSIYKLFFFSCFFRIIPMFSVFFCCFVLFLHWKKSPKIVIFICYSNSIYLWNIDSLKLFIPCTRCVYANDGKIKI